MKLKIDTEGIKFKIAAYFILFTACLMVFIWVLQVIFLNTSYETLKTYQTNKTIAAINEAYEDCNTARFLKKVETIANTNDLYIYLISEDGQIISYQPSEEVTGAGFYYQQIETVDPYLKRSDSGEVKLTIKGLDNTKEVLAYAKELVAPDSTWFKIYLFSPLWPVKSTINVLTYQLVYVTIISLIVAGILSLYLTTRITRPIRQIAASAERLADGEYGIVFKGGHYTEINNLADTLTRASIELEKSDTLQKDLVANVSHDLRTPLTMIKSYAEMIRDISGDNPEKRDQHLQVIIDETDRLNNLVNDLLSVSSMQSGKMKLEEAEFNLSEATRSIVNTYMIRNEEGYNITLNCPAEFYVYGDAEKIKQVISNLITNAIKFCGDDKVIKIGLTRRGRNKIACTVEDHGIGIAEDELEHIWDRYYKASSNMVRSLEGSGLGLSIIKEILVLHKAEYGVNSTLGKGTTFWFEMNLTRIDDTALSPVFTLIDNKTANN